MDRRIPAASLAVILAAGLASCERSNAQALATLEEPAHVSGHVEEAALNTITLTAMAEQRLAIAVAPVERRAVSAVRTLGGEVIAPAAGAAQMTRFDATADLSAADLAGAQIDADGAVERAQVAVDAARRTYERVQSLVEARAESARALEDAAAALDTAESDLRTAEARRGLLGQSVASAEAPPLVWVRASIYGGDLGRLDPDAAARVSRLGSADAREGRLVAAPVTASAASGTAFVFYEVDNADGIFRMGERVDLAIPTTDEAEALVAPWSAVLYDINGGEWVYERIDDLTYARRRVEIAAVIDDVAVLARGPEEGTLVVFEGAPELFGTEFGVAH